jgi:predicted ATP-grasp superfamily ATP-dependent carboligase
MEIAENQNLEHFAPLMIRELHLSDGALSVASRAMDAVEDCKVNIMLRTFTAVAQVFDRELAHDIKDEILTDMLRSFERVGGLVSLISVDLFKREDIYHMEEISEALNTLKPLFKKANA